MSKKYLLLILMLFFFIGCNSKPYFVKNLKQNNSKQKVTIYITNHGWHTGVIIPSDNNYTKDRLNFLYDRFGNQRFFEMGWGDKGFYQSNEVTTKLTLKAMFWASDTVMHIVAFDKNPKIYFAESEIKKLEIELKDYLGLLKFIKNSFYFDENGIKKLKNGLYGDSQFYEAIGKYYLFNTCNVWTAKALKSANFKIYPNTKLTASSVMNFLEEVD